MGLETSLKRLVGVKNISVDVLEGRVEIPGGDFDLEVPGLVKVVRDNGFTISSLRIKATGKVEKNETGYSFVLEEKKTRYPLNENDVLNRLIDRSQTTDTPFNILGRVVIPPPKGEAAPEDPVGSLTLEKFVLGAPGGGNEP